MPFLYVFRVYSDPKETHRIEDMICPTKRHRERKAAKDKEAGRLRLQQALDQLRESYEETLAFFDFNSSNLSDWQANRCPTNWVPELTKTVENLMAQLDLRHTLTQQHPPPNYQEARKYRTDLDAVEAEISALAKQLDQDFSETALEPPQTLDSPLRSVWDVALLLQEEDSDEHWVSLVWSLLAEKDWAGAYWLVHSLKAAGRDVPGLSRIACRASRLTLVRKRNRHFGPRYPANCFGLGSPRYYF